MISPNFLSSLMTLSNLVTKRSAPREVPPDAPVRAGAPAPGIAASGLARLRQGLAGWSVRPLAQRTATVVPLPAPSRSEAQAKSGRNLPLDGKSGPSGTAPAASLAHPGTLEERLGVIVDEVLTVANKNIQEAESPSARWRSAPRLGDPVKERMVIEAFREVFTPTRAAGFLADSDKTAGKTPQATLFNGLHAAALGAMGRLAPEGEGLQKRDCCEVLARLSAYLADPRTPYQALTPEPTASTIPNRARREHVDVERRLACLAATRLKFPYQDACQPIAQPT